MSFPLVFKQSIDVTGVTTSKDADGNVVVKADTVTHGLTIGGFERNATHKGVTLEVLPKK